MVKKKMCSKLYIVNGIVLNSNPYALPSLLAVTDEHINRYSFMRPAVIAVVLSTRFLATLENVKYQPRGVSNYGFQNQSPLNAFTNINYNYY